MHKVMFYISMVVIAFAGLSMIYFFWLISRNSNPPIEFENGDSLDVVSGSYDGRSIEVMSNGCVYTDAPSEVSYTIIGEHKYSMPSIDFVGGKNYNGKCFKNSISIRPLPEIPTGRYVIEFSAKYKVNAIATRYVSSSTEKFYINSDDGKTN